MLCAGLEEGSGEARKGLVLVNSALYTNGPVSPSRDCALRLFGDRGGEADGVWLQLEDQNTAQIRMEGTADLIETN